MPDYKSPTFCLYYQDSTDKFANQQWRLVKNYRVIRADYVNNFGLLCTIPQRLPENAANIDNDW
ncbi:hypothetical protein SAMN06296036_12193 [Pseudobacteriovorax antillogorgiicola]|uniref:Uncharacterized protein n=1 Tax=Pseudobacteriovorax antillogorgiicola TaxID=1513793 RepID=A0A1Y6CGH7_9BACT|nr:hypothetical protein EDD56_12193 [Pseudobacteriovorax antillogorgiicola]SMF62784.1 hypothetical protein SAMN06296036_12193 [Pseudobacteriovorax antillogorgiicola]